MNVSACSHCVYGINRIRLEFKDLIVNGANPICEVLIESDWNLKKDVVEWIYESDMTY